MPRVEATLHGAVSIVNAIATGKGATLGISLKTKALVETSPGNGVFIESKNKTISSRLINNVIRKVIPKNELDKTYSKYSRMLKSSRSYNIGNFP